MNLVLQVTKSAVMYVRCKAVWKLATDPQAIRQSLYVAMVVGTILNLINQGDPLLRFRLGHLHLGKFALTYCVPYLVSIYSSTLSQLRFAPKSLAALDARLQCTSCGASEIVVHRGERIPECPTCRERTRWKTIDLAC